MRFKISTNLTPDSWDDYVMKYWTPSNGAMVPCESDIVTELVVYLPDDVDMDTLSLEEKD